MLAPNVGGVPGPRRPSSAGLAAASRWSRRADEVTGRALSQVGAAECGEALGDAEHDGLCDLGPALAAGAA